MWRLGFSCLLGFSTLAAHLFAQQPVTGPGAGMIFDPPTRSVRPILGVSGAAYLGGVVLADVDFASVAPGGSAAVFAREGKLWAISWVRGEERRTLLFNLTEEAQAPSAVWASDGSAAVVAAGSNRVLLKVSTLEAEQIAMEAGREAVAVAPGGELLLLTNRAVKPYRLYTLKPGEMSRFAGDFQGTAPVFLSRASAVWVSAAGELVQFESANATTATLAPLDGMEVSALAADTSRKSVFVAGARSVRVFNMEQRSFGQEIAAEMPIDRLLPLTDSLFLTSARATDQETVWVF